MSDALALPKLLYNNNFSGRLYFRRSSTSLRGLTSTGTLRVESPSPDVRGVHVPRLSRPVVRCLYLERRHLGPDHRPELDGPVAHQFGLFPRSRLVPAA